MKLSLLMRLRRSPRSSPLAENNAGNSKVQVLSYHGNAFVTGLLWHPLGSLTGYMKEARQFGRQESMDIVAIRRTESIIQAGFVSRSDGAVKGMYSLAAALAGQLGKSWLAAWRIAPDEDRYALVAVLKGAVIPGCDLVGTAETIKRKVAQQLSREITFEEIFLPAEFEHGGKPIDIEQLLRPERLKREYRLRPLAFGLSREELLKLGALGALGLIALVGFQRWQAHQAELARQAAQEAERRRQAELAELAQRSGETQPAQALEHPWAKQPSVTAFVEGCNAMIDQLPLSVAGWLFSAAQCDGTLVSANYKRTGNSTTGEFSQAIEGHFAEAPAFYDEGNSAAVKTDLVLPLAGDESLRDASTALADLTSWLQQQSLVPAIKEVPVVVPTPPAMPGQPAPPPPPLPDWKHFEVQTNSPLPPALFLDGIEGRGLRLREITTQLQGHQLRWSITGDLYAK